MVKKFFIGFLDLLLLALAIIIVGISIRAAWFSYYRAAFPTRYSELVMLQSAETGVPPEFLFAVIRTESGFDPSVEHPAVSARGLMQITEDTFEWIKYRTGDKSGLRFDDLFQSDVNIRYGSELIRLLLLEFGSENNALCAYHAGWGNAQKWLDDSRYAEDGEIVNIPFADTRYYVGKVLKTKEIYNTLYDFERIAD